jgi:Zn-dependent protease/CBS domain-containing protein
MKWSVTLFRVRGIEVKVHATFGLVLLWAAYYWSSNVDDKAEGAVFGIVATLLLFAAVTLHELAHSLQAMRYGVKVEDITLYPIGGVARMEEIPDKPRQELGIAIVGPLTNLALAAMLWGIGALLDWRSVISLHDLYASLGDASWSGLLAYLTWANLALGLFNLIPAFPMDGGRVLRALLAMRMDYVRATRIAVALGQGLALLLGFVGFATFSPSLILIAVFVWIAGGQEGRQVEVKGTLRETKVAQAMTWQPRSLAPDNTLAQAADFLLSTEQTAFPVVAREDERLVGLLTEIDLVKALRAQPATAPLREAIQTDALTTTPDEPLFQAMQRMATGRSRAMAVVDPNGTLIGLLTAEGINEAYRLLAVSPTVAQRSDASTVVGPARPAVAS